jgi:hypothetical protein
VWGCLHAPFVALMCRRCRQNVACSCVYIGNIHGRGCASWWRLAVHVNRRHVPLCGDLVWCGFQTAGSVVEPAILQRSDDRLYGLHIRDTPSFLSSSVDRLYQELELVTPLSVFVLSVARPLGSP